MNSGIFHFTLHKKRFIEASKQRRTTRCFEAIRPRQTSLASCIDRIPKDHLMKRIASAVDFSFINGLVADSYCSTFGIPAKEPELMANFASSKGCMTFRDLNMDVHRLLGNYIFAVYRAREKC